MARLGDIPASLLNSSVISHRVKPVLDDRFDLEVPRYLAIGPPRLHHIFLEGCSISDLRNVRRQDMVGFAHHLTERVHVQTGEPIAPRVGAVVQARKTGASLTYR